MTEGSQRRWWLALGASVTAGVCAQPLPGHAEAPSLTPIEHQFRAECRQPDVELCAVKSPGISIYKVLTPDISFDDLVSHWVVDLRKFTPAPGIVKYLRVSGTSGEVYSIRMSLIYEGAVLARAAAQAKAIKDAKELQDGPAHKKATPAVNATVATTNVPKPVPSKADGPVTSSPPTAAPEAPRASSSRSPRPSARNNLTPSPEASPSASAPAPSLDVLAVPSATQLPCLDGICIGASVKTLNAPFEPVISVAQQLRMNLTPSKRNPDIEERAARLESLYRKGDMERFANEGQAWVEASREQKILRNLRHLHQAYAIALQALGGNHSPQVVELAKYFVPDRLGTFEANIKADPLVFVESSALRFDQGFVNLLKKTKTTFCGVYTFSGRYMSKSGYETHVQLRSDMDGDFKVSFIERKFSSPSLDSLLLLEKELKQRYAAYIPASLVNADRDKERFLLLPLQLRHPVMLRAVGLRSDAQDLRAAFWQMGWMDFKGRELEIKNVMSAISERKKKEIPMCKPQALSVD